MKKIMWLGATLLVGLSFSSLAEVRINGFSNIVAGYSSDENEQYGYDDSITTTNESLFALQVSADISDRLTATGQIMARGRDDFDATFEWAYLSYKANDNFEIFAGRLRLPLFLYSDSVDIGYSYHWIVPPESVYDVQFNNIDGVKLSYSGYKGGWDYAVNLAYGSIYVDDIEGLGDELSVLDAESMRLISLEASKGSFKARGVYLNAKASILTPTLSAAIDGIGAVVPDLADSLAFEDDIGEFFGLSLGYDTYDWFALAEYTLSWADDTFLADIEAVYVTAGARFGKYTPSITWLERDTGGDIKFLDQLEDLPPAVQQSLAPVVTGIQLTSFDTWGSFTLGLRYDYSAKVALKGELIDYYDDLDDSNDTNMFRIAISYIF